jgi:hypothetical protein
MNAYSMQSSLICGLKAEKPEGALISLLQDNECVCMHCTSRMSWLFNGHSMDIHCIQELMGS